MSNKEKKRIMVSESKNIAKNLDQYLDAVTRFFILEGKKKKVEESIEVVKQAIKDLKNKKLKEVFDMDEFEKFCANKYNFKDEYDDYD